MLFDLKENLNTFEGISTLNFQCHETEKKKKKMKYFLRFERKNFFRTFIMMNRPSDTMIERHNHDVMTPDTIALPTYKCAADFTYSPMGK